MKNKKSIKKTPKTPLKKIRKWDEFEHFHARLTRLEIDTLRSHAFYIKMQRDKKRGVQREYITPNSILRAAIAAYMMLTGPGPMVKHRRMSFANINTERELIDRVFKASWRKPLTLAEIKKACDRHLRELDRMIKAKEAKEARNKKRTA